MPEPVSTSEIAARVFEDAGEPIDSSNEFAAESGDTGVSLGDSAGDTGGAAPSGAEATPGSQSPAPVDRDELLEELGLQPRTDGREHKIPLHRVRKINENARKKERAAVEAEWQPKLTAAEQKAREIEESEAAFYNVVQTDPDRAIKILSAVNPVFGEFVRQAQRQAAAEQRQFRMPEPDQALPGGGRTYSVEGVQKAILDAMEYATQVAEQRISERYKPLEQTHAQLQEERARGELNSKTEQRVQTLYSDAQTWPGFKEHEAEIQKAFNEDFKDLPLESALNAAYRKVVIQAMQAANAQTRAKVIGELQRQPRNTSVVGSQGAQAPPERTGPRTTEQIARDVVRRLSQQSS